MRFSREFLRTCLLVVVALAICLPQMLLAAPLFKSGDRVVIFGDSITEQRLYSRFIEQYVYCRYPELKVHFYNAGWGGDTAAGALKRLDRDVLSLNPTAVTLFFGMNDGGYRAVDNGITTSYRNNVEQLIKLLQAKGIRVAVFAPSCIDPDYRNDKDLYNTTLETLGKNALELAKQYNCPSADVFHPMLAYQKAQKAINPAFTLMNRGDSVHPNYSGHLVMVTEMLKALGVDPMPALGEADMSNGKVDGLSITSKNPDKIVLQTVGSRPLPFWFDPASMNVAKSCGFLDLAGQKLTVKGLTAPSYILTVDDAQVGRFTQDQLAAGIIVPGTYSQRGKIVHELAWRKENAYFTAWREIRLPLDGVTGVKPIVDNMMANDDTFHNILLEQAKPVDKTTITLTAMQEGLNLAEGKTYTASDPNRYGWGAASLTDGSWDMSQAHCWASGDGATFPKTLTIDLQKTQRVNKVITGVPNFGSTRTIKVAVSNDGTNFTEVGSHEFKLRTEERFTYSFNPVDARYVQLIYPDRYDEEVNYSKNFSFTTEVEVYGK